MSEVRLFVVGCPRSGTTWVQRLLAGHPDVATGPESHVLPQLVAPLLRAWDEDVRRVAVTPKSTGLANYMDRARYLDRVRHVAEGIFDAMRVAHPGARVLVEKTPDHVHHVPAILELWPDARFLHVLRDPRGAAASLMAAGRSWGSVWVSRSPRSAARRWLRAVRDAERIASLTPHVRTIRYEQLHTDGPAELAALYTWLGLDAAADVVAAALETASFQRLQRDADAEFYRRGQAEGWREELSRDDVRAIERLVWDVMQAEGYVPTARRRPWGVTPWGVVRRLGAEMGRLRRRIGLRRATAPVVATPSTAHPALRGSEAARADG